MEISPPKITPILREITDQLHLTRLGQLKLLSIPEGVLSSVWSHYKKLSGINQPFDWLMANCVRRSENLGVPIDWQLFHLSLKRYNLSDNKRYVAPKPIIKAEVVVSERSADRPHRDKKTPHPLFAKYFEIAMAHSSES